ncbi:NAD(FAD)-dependent dehydrogenase [Vallitalea longa]|uniref:NAD(FAD)-dependent dehydrogenase n=1 Tax=Vallitalea longa TaxID=2936439 RepID=A0A9W5YHS8_9FIRM|nr:NAD(FAD)-dependent dehydrogenase [Vallitalea longa]
MIEKRKLVCIACPIGCNITVTLENNEVIKVEGNTCKRGEMYAKTECTNPTRILTTTMKVRNGRLPVVSVKSDKPLPKESLLDCMKMVNDVVLEAPMKIGDVAIRDIVEGVNIVLTRDIDKAL